MRGLVITEKFTDHTETLNRYLADIKSEELLTPEEEFQLFVKYKNESCEKCKEKIIKANLRFVISVAKQYKSKNVLIEDLISEGNKGLLEGVEKFDPYMGFKFISYAVWYIRKHIHLYLSDLSRTVRIPAKVTADIRKYQEFENSLANHMGRIPTVEETLDYIEESSDFNLSRRSVESIKENPTSVPLDPPKSSSSSEEGFSPIDWIDSGIDADSTIKDRERKELLMNLLSKLGYIEKKVIIMKFGLEDGFPMGYKEIGEKLGRSGEWARIMGKKAQRRLKILAIRNKIGERL